MAIRHNDVGALSDVADETIKEHQNQLKGYFWRGTVEAIRKEYDKAVADYQTVLKIDPNSSAAYLELGQIAVAQGRTAEGQAMFEKALDKDPNSVRGLASIVELDMKAKQPDKALARAKEQIARPWLMSRCRRRITRTPPTMRRRRCSCFR
jgi:tetratricopeptide (TPR) repeat protein